MTKLFVTDLDGTLLSKDHKISSRNREALQMLVDSGYEIAFCSGRILSSVKSLAEPLGFVDFHIANNGAVVSYKNEIIYEKALDYPKLRKIVDLAYENDKNYHMYDKDTYYSDLYKPNRLVHMKRDDGDGYHVKVRCHPDILSDIIQEKISIYKITLHMSFINEPEIFNKVSELENLAVYMSGAWSSDIMEAGISKGNAIKQIELNLDKKYDKIVAIGDHQNDIDMVQYADVGIAMGNAIDELKEVSDYITDSNEDDGFYKAVKYILEGEK